jgi:hypothetical protein
MYAPFKLLRYFQENWRSNMAAENLCMLTQRIINTCIYIYIMWRIDPLLGNYSANTSPREPMRATIRRLLLVNASVNTPKTIRDIECGVFCVVRAEGLQETKKIVWVSIEKSRVSRRQPTKIWAREQRIWIESSLRNWQLQNNGKKGIRLWKEDFMCDLKWQWDCFCRIATAL